MGTAKFGKLKYIPSSSALYMMLSVPTLMALLPPSRMAFPLRRRVSEQSVENGLKAVSLDPVNAKLPWISAKTR